MGRAAPSALRCLAVTGWLLSSASLAQADELQAVFRQLIANPTSPELNLRYAALAETKGVMRKAFAAYERVLANHPDHKQARREINRIRRLMLPQVTARTVSVGARYESNARQFAPGLRQPQRRYLGDQLSAL